MPRTLFGDFKDFLKIMDNHKFFYEDVIDINSCQFFTPTLLLPLISLSENHDKKIGEHNNANLNKYKNSVLGYIDHKNTTLPMRRIKKDNATQLTNDLFNLLNQPNMGENSFKFIFYELLQNVYDHSNFNNGFVLGQMYHNANMLDISFMDNGLGISGSYKKAGYSFKNDCYAILEAINGHSSKWEYGDDYQRGSGLNNTINIIVNGAHGEVLIVSGTGLVHIKQNHIFLKEIPKDYIKGTMISIRLKVNFKEKLHVNSYLRKVNLFKDGENMAVKEVWLEKEIESDLGSRNKIENLFNMLNGSNAKKVVMNFDNIQFMSRSAAQEYLNQKNKANFQIEERNIPDEIQEMFNIIIELNNG